LTTRSKAALLSRPLMTGVPMPCSSTARPVADDGPARHRGSPAAAGLFDALLQSADRETLLMLVPLLARLGESPSRNR
jgi:hypothetical protein